MDDTSLSLSPPFLGGTREVLGVLHKGRSVHLGILLSDPTVTVVIVPPRAASPSKRQLSLSLSWCITHRGQQPYTAIVRGLRSILSGIILTVLLSSVGSEL